LKQKANNDKNRLINFADTKQGCRRRPSSVRKNRTVENLRDNITTIGTHSIYLKEPSQQDFQSQSFEEQEKVAKRRRQFCQSNPRTVEQKIQTLNGYQPKDKRLFADGRGTESGD
jgi:hypothetical protein